ncbi:glycerophosphodiester phosphodiesterase GDPD6-like [Colias croceus]|uniref:glycerophosphodiester phosphodiesterase GDPD6-like n=1 Tax=Colias crocea TaxID=72248 RepID=UPI001E27F4D4|nr:glycerophosphodiester phosphodiesterase GDPD6-like [Colias croceus]
MNILSIVYALGFVCSVYALPNKEQKKYRRGPDDCEPVVVAHRGASGYVPEHTLGAYALSVTMGADYVEPDLVMTKDGHLIARHENQLDVTTDVAQRPEFADRYRTISILQREISGWFSEDFTLAEIKTLRAIESLPRIRPGNTRMDGAFEIPTFQEIIDLVRGLEVSENRTIGIYPEIKLGSYFKLIGLPMEQAVVDAFHKNGYMGPSAPAYIQSFEINNLKELKAMTELRLLQLIGRRQNQPLDQMIIGSNLTYGDMVTAEGLKEISKYAHAVGPDKSHIIPRDSRNRLGRPTTFVADAHAVGLKVHPYTFRAENAYLPIEFRSEDPSDSAFGNFNGELKAFLATGIDGLFIDQPDFLVRLRNPCV